MHSATFWVCLLSFVAWAWPLSNVLAQRDGFRLTVLSGIRTFWKGLRMGRFGQRRSLQFPPQRVPLEMAWNHCQKFPNDPYQLSPKVYAEHETRSANAVPERTQSPSFNHFSCHNHHISIQDGLGRLEPCSARLRMSMEVVGDVIFSAASREQFRFLPTSERGPARMKLLCPFK